MRGVCRRCARLGHSWVYRLVRPGLAKRRYCGWCGLCEYLGGTATRRGEQWELWYYESLDDRQRFLVEMSFPELQRVQ